MIELTAIRHTQVNVPAGLCYGQTDVGLASTYPEELKQIRLKLIGQQFDTVYCSPLSRCRQLAAGLFPGKLSRVDERLMELNFGHWEMLPWDTITATPDADDWFADFVRRPAPGGESFSDLLARTASFLRDLNTKPATHVAVVTHSGILRALSCLLAGTEPTQAFRLKIDYGEVMHFGLPEHF